MPPNSFDPVWNDIYDGGHEQKAPWDSVISFVYRHRPRDVSASATRILEVGFGTASNLRFFAREGFQVAGIEGAIKAVEVAEAYFEEHGLVGDLRAGDYKTLPFDGECFHLAIDRAALVHSGLSTQKQAIEEIWRTLKPEGVFHYMPYADTHSSAQSGHAGYDGVTVNIQAGTLMNVGQLCFISEDNIHHLLPEHQWNIISLEYQTSEDFLKHPTERVHSNWRVIARKKG